MVQSSTWIPLDPAHRVEMTVWRRAAQDVLAALCDFFRWKIEWRDDLDL